MEARGWEGRRGQAEDGRWEVEAGGGQAGWRGRWGEGRRGGKGRKRPGRGRAQGPEGRRAQGGGGWRAHGQEMVVVVAAPAGREMEAPSARR